MTQLRDYRFPATQIEWRPVSISKDGTRAAGGAYVDVRVIADTLDTLAPGWESRLDLQHTGKEYCAVCRLLVDGVERSDVGVGATPMDASNQAFRRAAAAHGLGRYLWLSGQHWAEFDNQRKQFTAQGLAKLNASLQPAQKPADAPLAANHKRNGHVQEPSPTAEPWAAWAGPQDAYAWAVAQGHCKAEAHARNALKKIVEQDFGGHLKADNWRAVAAAFYADRTQRAAEKAAA